FGALRDTPIDWFFIMLRRWLVLSLCIVNSHSQSCQKWSEEDQSNNDCRACRVITIDRLANCPETGYACDEREPLSAAVLSSSDTCRCQSLRCAHKEWRLAVNGTIVDKVRCNGKQWVSSGLVAPSFVCAIPTDKGIPATPKPLVCPVLQPASLTACAAAAGGGRVCVPAVIQEPTVSCGAGYFLYVVDTMSSGTGVDKVICNPNTKLWELTNPGPDDGPVTAVACHPP
ncbi:hypothetical protein PENTCL1PPCAC_16377, partial [Pristionchus entomophagus]